MAALDNGNNNAINVNVNTNFQLEVHPSTTERFAGFTQISNEVDSGTTIGSRTLRAPKVTGGYRLKMSDITPLFYDQFMGSTLNSGIWTAPVSTMTVTTASGFAFLNAGASTLSGASAMVQSYRLFPMYNSGILKTNINIQFSLAPQANNTCEWGFGGVSGSTDGVFFRLNATGIVGVASFNGTETTTSTLNFSSLIGTNTTKTTEIVILPDRAEFWISDVLVAIITLPSTQPAMVSSNQAPVYFKNNNTGTASGAQAMKVGSVVVMLYDSNEIRDYRLLLTGMGGTAAQGHTGITMGSTAVSVNSTNPTAAVPTNTTAALGSGLGGEFWETDTLAITTDGIISSYQVPVGTSTSPGMSLYITGVRIDSYVQTVLGAGTGYNAQWCLAFGHTAVSLATTETSTSKAPRRIALGSNTVGATLAALSQLTTIKMDFTAPICVQPGEFIQTVKKKVGAAPASGVIAHSITFIGIWE